MLRKPPVAAVLQRMCISIGCNTGVTDTTTADITTVMIDMAASGTVAARPVCVTHLAYTGLYTLP